MQLYTKKALNYFGYTETDWIPCMICGTTAVDTHHIEGRGKNKTNNPKNLLFVCRRCHQDIHNNKYSKDYQRSRNILHHNKIKGLKKE